RWESPYRRATNTAKRFSPTSIYAEVDLASKRKAVRAAKPLLSPDPGCAQWRTQADTLTWLESL
ncbi:MAG: hypothetical protein OXN89_21880, partial [Bryobacterales bacterium]|nr:hypothetical protein [Bryobacterales bacterium]